MTRKEIFKEVNVNLFSPCSNEFLFDFIYLLGYTDKEINDKKIKEDVLSTLEILFNLKIIFIYKWFKESELNDRDLSIGETIAHINRIWFKGATYPDFYNMVMFGSQKWYVDKLWDMGMSHTTNWKWFVENKIGNLEKWIEENRPKE